MGSVAAMTFAEWVATARRNESPRRRLNLSVARDFSQYAVNLATNKILSANRKRRGE